MKHKDNCENIKSMLEKYIDQELSANESGLVREHLKLCGDCSKKYEQILEIDKIGKLDIFPDPGAKFWEEQRQFISDKISGTPAREKVIEHWSKRMLFSGAFKTAVGLSAAAMFIFFMTKEYQKIPVGKTSKTETEELLTYKPAGREKETGKEEAKTSPQKPVITTAAAGKSADEFVMADEEQDVETTITKKIKPAEQPEISAADTQSLKERLVSPGELKVKTLDKPEIRITDDLVEVSSARTAGGARANPVAGASPQRSLFKLDESLKMPKKEAEEFKAYTYNKTIIEELENLIDRKNSWVIFLDELNEEVVIELVVNDIWDLYNKIVIPESDPELKKECLEFIKKYKDKLTARMGKSRYKQYVDFLEKIQS